LHGFVSLEIEGAFASMGIDPDAVFHREVMRSQRAKAVHRQDRPDTPQGDRRRLTLRFAVTADLYRC
jgi:hypothetical protein